MTLENRGRRTEDGGKDVLEITHCKGFVNCFGLFCCSSPTGLFSKISQKIQDNIELTLGEFALILKILVS